MFSEYPYCGSYAGKRICEVIMKNLTIITLMVAICCLLSCEGEQTPTTIINQQSVDDPEAIVRSNAIILQDAVEAYLEEMGSGSYPMDAYMDTTILGNTVIDLLPGGEQLLNPYTGERTLPVDGPAINPGEIGYHAWASCYSITGFGSDSLIIELSNARELDAKTIINCYELLAAADAFAMDNGGVYAYDGITVNDSGKTMVEYLPGGMLLENAYLGIRIEPAKWGSQAANSGEIGYNPICISGVYVGCMITGAERGGMVFYTLLRGVDWE
jgi:hypothetical protein